ncbi:MAG: nitrogen fixation protein FixH [Alphaproteobacteria bacterium]|jgi:nitrogen fixation protein FixH
MVLIAMVAFFVVIAVVNGIFVYLSLSTFPGVETEGAYRKGLTYNQTLSEAEVLRALGWRANLTWQAQDPGDGRFTLRLTGMNGARLTGKAVILTLRRSVHAGADRDLPMGEDGPGVYGTKTLSIGPGNWDVIARVIRPGKVDFIHRHRIIVP